MGFERVWAFEREHVESETICTRRRHREPSQIFCIFSPLSYATYNLLFVNDYADGLIHTEAEHRTWLEEAGFEYVLRQPSAPSYAADFILARKPAA